MTEPTRVANYGDLIRSDLSVDEADAVARELANGAEFVARIPDWLYGKKGFDGGLAGVISGELVYESEKAYLVGIEGEDVWLPKSHTQVYEATPDAELYLPADEQA